MGGTAIAADSQIGQQNAWPGRIDFNLLAQFADDDAHNNLMLGTHTRAAGLEDPVFEGPGAVERVVERWTTERALWLRDNAAVEPSQRVIPIPQAVVECWNGAKNSACDEYRQAVLALGRPIDSVRDPNRRIGERDIGRTVPEWPVPPPPPAPVVAASPPPSNLAKVTILRNGEAKEHSVTRSDHAATQGRRSQY